jgi:hypothetical protein
VLAIRLSNMPHSLGGWVTDIWDYSPAPWIYKLYYLQYLCIVLPGTIAGDLIVRWSGPFAQTGARQWSIWRVLVIAVLMMAFVLVLLIGLKSRWLTATPVAIFVLCLAGWPLVRNPNTPGERLCKHLYSWAIYWMILGLCLESYEGGIRKDKATVSYYFVTSGLANAALIFLWISMGFFKRRFSLLVQTGQNPMVAYAGVNNFIDPLLALTGVGALLDQWASSPWRGFCRGVFVTLMMGVVTAFLTRRKIFWRT